MKKKALLSLVLALSLLFTACGDNKGNTAEQSEKAESLSKTEIVQDSTTTAQTEVANESATREIMGLDGNSVVVPPVEELQNIVVLHPTLLSYVIRYAPDRNSIVGSHVAGLAAFDEEIKDLIFPEWKNVNTSLTAEGSFGANIEEMMKVEPDLIFYDANYQADGLDKVDTCKIPIDLTGYNDDTERVAIEMANVCREIFNVKEDSILENQWELANNKAKELVDFSEDKKTVLFIWQDTGEQLTVAGKGTAIVKTCEKLNLENVAREIEGAQLVNMEQIYQWNPDYIFLLSPNAKEILAGEDKQKDWTKLTAFKERHIYSVPSTQLNWVFPSMDSPLCIYYLINKCYPEKLSDEEMDKIFFDYYKTVYDVELQEELINRIMNK